MGFCESEAFPKTGWKTIGDCNLALFYLQNVKPQSKTEEKRLYRDICIVIGFLLKDIGVSGNSITQW
jgi:hypothetical protein